MFDRETLQQYIVTQDPELLRHFLATLPHFDLNPISDDGRKNLLFLHRSIFTKPFKYQLPDRAIVTTKNLFCSLTPSLTAETRIALLITPQYENKSALQRIREIKSNSLFHLFLEEINSLLNSNHISDNSLDLLRSELLTEKTFYEILLAGDEENFRCYFETLKKICTPGQIQFCFRGNVAKNFVPLAAIELSGNHKMLSCYQNALLELIKPSTEVMEILSVQANYLLPYPRIHHDHPFNHLLELFVSDTANAGYPAHPFFDDKKVADAFCF